VKPVACIVLSLPPPPAEQFIASEWLGVDGKETVKVTTISFLIPPSWLQITINKKCRLVLDCDSRLIENEEIKNFFLGG
jgi:hypothetical protein